jgi:hypothetical protein
MKKIAVKINRINLKVAKKLSNFLSSMGCFYVIAIMVIVPLFVKVPASLIEWIIYLSSAVFQAIALPILAYTSMINGNKTDEIMTKIFKMTEKIEHLTEKIEKNEENIQKEIIDITQ